MVAIIAVSAKDGGHLAVALYALQVHLPLLGRGEGGDPADQQEQALPKTAMAMATSPMRPARLVAR
jgi:hypothetical protein